MPRVAVPELTGPSNTLDATNQANYRTVNMYLEPSAPVAGKAAYALRKRPGLSPLFTVPDSPWRRAFYQDGRSFGVVGTTFIEWFSDNTYSVRGTLLTNSNEVTIVSGGTAAGQLLIAAGKNGYVYDLTHNTLTIINTTNFPGTGFPVNNALRCEFIDGYFIVMERNSRKFYISALEDATSWDALDVAERSEGSDNFVSMCRNHRELWLLGTLTGEVWYNNGDALFPFAPIPGVFIQVGAVSSSTSSGGDPLCRVDTGSMQTVAWVSGSEFGESVVMLAEGYVPRPMSPVAVTAALQQSVVKAHVFLFSFQIEAHYFLCVYYPDLQNTWVYDTTTNSWFEWNEWNADTAQEETWVIQCCAYAFGKTVGGSALDGTLYEMSLSVYDDELTT